MPAVTGVVKGWVEGGWALSKQWVLGIEKPRQAVLGNVARPPSSSAWPVPRAPNHTMGRPTWQAHAPAHLTMAATIQQRLDTLEGNAWDTMPGSTPTESVRHKQASSQATRFSFGNNRCVRLVHAACKMGEYMLLMAGRYESSTDNALAGRVHVKPPSLQLA